MIIPAFNEGDRLAAGFARLERAAAEGRVNFDDLALLLVDDGSTDDTAAAAASLMATLPHGRVITKATNRGKGAAVRAGVAAATTRSLVFSDADMAIDPRQLPALLAALDDAPIAVGSRAVQGRIDYGSWLRTRAGRSFNHLVRRVSSVELRDTQCGFKALSTPHAKILFALSSIDGFAFDVELLNRSRRLGWDIAEVPVSWSDVTGSHVHLARDSITMLVDLVVARAQSSSLPTIAGLVGLDHADRSAISAAVAGTALQAAPVLQASDGSLSLLAPLVPDAGPMLDAVAATLGGDRQEVTADIIGASVVAPALL